MAKDVKLVSLFRGDWEESSHSGWAVIANAKGEIVESWGDPEALIYPRSSVKMIQALPLIEGGYGDDLTSEQLALACASHQGAAIHRDSVKAWLEELGKTEADLICGPQEPSDREERYRLIRADEAPSRFHNNCSGKHAGFLALDHHLQGGANYTDVAHPVQQAVRQTFNELTEEEHPGYGLDGCSAPNFVCSMGGLAKAMAKYATAHERDDTRSKAMVRLTQAMAKHPVLIAGEKRACTNLVRTMNNGTVVKTGAEGVYTAILPGKKLGVAVKIKDGATRASEAVITALMVRLGQIDETNPVAQQYLTGPLRNWDKLVIGKYQVEPSLLG